VDAAKRKYLEEKSVEYKVNPVALGFFGGCYDINKMSWFFKKSLINQTKTRRSWLQGIKSWGL